MPRPLLLLGPALYPPCDCVVFFVCRPSLPPPGPCLGGVAIEGSPLQRWYYDNATFGRSAPSPSTPRERPGVIGTGDSERRRRFDVASRVVRWLHSPACFAEGSRAPRAHCLLELPPRLS